MYLYYTLKIRNVNINAVFLIFLYSQKGNFYALCTNPEGLNKGKSEAGVESDKTPANMLLIVMNPEKLRIAYERLSRDDEAVGDRPAKESQEQGIKKGDIFYKFLREKERKEFSRGGDFCTKIIAENCISGCRNCVLGYFLLKTQFLWLYDQDNLSCNFTRDCKKVYKKVYFFVHGKNGVKTAINTI